MFVGHFAVAFALRSRIKNVSLAAFIFAAELIDFIWPLLILSGVESVRITPGHTAVTPLEFVSYPYSHSLLLTAVYAAVFFAMYYVFTHELAASFLLGMAVLSHWALDFVAHVPDLPLTPWSSSYVGLGLWQSVPLSLIVEGGLFAAGVYLFMKNFKPASKGRLIGFMAMVLLLFLLWLMPLIAPPPPSEEAIAIGALFVLLFIPWAYFIDKRKNASGQSL